MLRQGWRLPGRYFWHVVGVLNVSVRLRLVNVVLDSLVDGEVELIRLLWSGRSGYRTDLSQWENPRILSPPHRHATALICSPSWPTCACPSPSPTLASPRWPEPRQQRQPAEPNNPAGPLCWRRSARHTSKQERAEYQSLLHKR